MSACALSLKGVTSYQIPLGRYAAEKHLNQLEIRLELTEAVVSYVWVKMRGPVCNVGFGRVPMANLAADARAVGLVVAPCFPS